MTKRGRGRLRRALPAAAIAMTAGLAAVAVPAAGATGGGSAAVPHDTTMYDIAVRATDGAGATLAQRLVEAGFDVTSRTGSTVHVLGGVATLRRLSRLDGSVVTGRRPAAPTGPVPAAPQSQDNILPRRLHGNHYPTFYGGYRTVAGYHQFESDLQTAYPDLVKEVTYGTSFSGANSLTAVCVTADAADGCRLTPTVDKARFLVVAQTHAREIATSEMAWRYLTMIVDGWKRDPQITSLLRSTEIWVVPDVNPDGIDKVQSGIKHHGTAADSPAWQRKNEDADQAPPGGCDHHDWVSSQIGVDLNRNFDSHWGGRGTSQDPCDQQYLGTDPASEPETIALSGLIGELFKDQRGSGPHDPAPPTTSGLVLSIHSFAGLVLMPWSYDRTVQTPNDSQLRSIAFRQSYFNGYTTGQWGDVLYDASGTVDDWTYDRLGVPAFTWELNGTGQCTDFLPPYSCMDAYAANNLPGLGYDAAVARAPYRLSFGPTLLRARSATVGGSVRVTATADDDAYGADGAGRPPVQQVTAGRIFVGTPPWDGGHARAMTVDGSGTSVTLTATVAPRASRVLAFVQGRDATGSWGPARAVWIPSG